MHRLTVGLRYDLRSDTDFECVRPHPSWCLPTHHVGLERQFNAVTWERVVSDTERQQNLRLLRHVSYSNVDIYFTKLCEIELSSVAGSADHAIVRRHVDTT